MKYSLTNLWLLLTLFGGGAFTSHAQSTTFTYQGRLQAASAPADGAHDFRFTLFGDSSGGGPIAGPLTNSAVIVSNGLFTVPLDFQPSLVALATGGFTGEERWLAIEVRPTGGGIFTPLSPRQPITPVPYAVTAFNALNVPGVSGHSLHAQDGGPANAVFVDDAGNVGVGTTTPGSQFHVASQPDEAAPPRLQSTGNTRFNAGWDFYHGSTGRGYVGVPDANAPIAPGELVLFGGPITKVSLWPGQNRALTANTLGSIGIGTDSPTAKLDVRGDIRMGPGGEIRAAGGEENLRIVRGAVNAEGGIVSGAGFTVSLIRNGIFRIAFNPPFAERPSVTVTPHSPSEPVHAMLQAVTESAVRVGIYEGDTTFDFIAIGPR